MATKKKRTAAPAHRKQTSGSTASAPGFFARHRAIFLSAWRSLWQWKTLLHIGLDVALLLFVAVLLTISTAVSSMIVVPLMPVLNAIGQLEASNGPDNLVTDADRVALLEQYQPDINVLLTKMAFVALGLYLLFIIGYTLLKTRIWTSLQSGRYSWLSLRKTFLLYLAWFLCLVLLPVLLMLAGPNIAAVAFLLLLFLTLAFLPLLAATAGTGWRPLLKAFFWRPFGHYCFVLLITLLTMVLFTNIFSLLIYINETLSSIVILVWLLIFMAWSRHYINNFVNEFILTSENRL